VATSVFIPLPHAYWRDAVATISLLPTLGNQIGDVIATQDTLIAYIWNGTAWQALTSGGGSGTVTSVGLALPLSVFTVSGSPVTTSGTLTGSFNTQADNTVFAGPSSGPAAVPTFRALVSSDIPALSYVSSVTASTPLASSGGLTPNITIQQSSGSQSGFLSSTDWTTFNSKQPAGSYITALTGDVTAAGPGSAAATLATVNANVGSFGSSTSIPSVTVNAKGLVTAASGNVVIAPAGTLSGNTLNATVVNSSLTSVGTITTGVWNGTSTSGSTFLTSGTAYTTPAGITTRTQFKFTLIGGGAGGTSGNVASQHSSGGGAGAGLILFIAGLSPSTGYTIAIGASGTGGASGAVGGAGGATTLTVSPTTYTAGGGSGAAVISSAGGVGGTATNGTINITGGQGGATMTVQSSAGLHGANAPFGFGFGGPGLSGSTSGNGNPAVGYGAGGGGSSSNGGPTGGAGAPGCILVEWQN
jgi:hypothetical protein